MIPCISIALARNPSPAWGQCSFPTVYTHGRNYLGGVIFEYAEVLKRDV
jgi:hypothetical protein